MPKIMIQTNDVRSASSKMSSVGQKHTDVIKAIKTAISLLDAGQEGEAKNKFKQIWGQHESTYMSFQGDITTFSNFLKNYVAKMEAEDKL